MLQVLCFETWPDNEPGHQVEEVDQGQTVAEQSEEACDKWPLAEPIGEHRTICDFVLNITVFLIVMNTKFAAAVMVLQDVVKPWMDGCANGHYYVFQQDGALTHNPKVTQNWWQGNLPEFWTKEVWPPSSPDCNPMDYYVWSVRKRDINKTTHNTATLLMAKLTEVMANLPRDTVVKVCRRFRQRISVVEEAGGDFFK